MPYKFTPEVTMADVAFKAEGKTLEELFGACAEAVTITMVKELESVKRTKKIKVKIEAKTIELLLFNFLNELLFYKDAKQLLFSKYVIKIKKLKGEFTLSATLHGEKLNMKKHELIVDVKAVTMHLFEVKREKITDRRHKRPYTVWKAQVVLDI